MNAYVSLVCRYRDAEKQEVASRFFKRVQEAYRVLSDPRLRAVYNRRGRRGLEEDMAIIERTALPAELLEEYEKLKSLWEERTYIQEVNPRGLFQVEVDASPLLEGTGWMSVKSVYSEQCADAQMSKSMHATILGTVFANRRGLVSGLQFSLKQLLEHQNWVKLSMLVGSQPALGLELYHSLSEQMYLTSENMIYLTPYGVMASLNAQVSRRLDERTMATLRVKETGNSVGLGVTRKLSDKLDVMGDVQIGYSSSHIKLSSKYQLRQDVSITGGVKLSTEGPAIFYGAQHQLGKLTEVGATILVGSYSGVSLKLRLSRATMNYVVKFQLSPVLSLQSIFYATLLPVLGYTCIRMLALAPLIHRQQKKEKEEKQAEREMEMTQRKKESEAAVELMKATVERNISFEQARHGLIIVEAWYGCLFDSQRSSSSSDPLAPPRVIDVVIPLQCLVSDSKLILRENSKALIPGFYDPCVGDKKHLRVRYSFRGNMHEVTVANNESLVIPRESHRIATTNT